MNSVSIKPTAINCSSRTLNIANRTPVKTTEAPCCENSAVNYAPLNVFNHQAYHQNFISFSGNSQQLLSKILETGGASKIYQSICNEKNTTPTQIRACLDSVLADTELAKNFILEITQDPRQSAETVINLTKKLGGPDKFRDWYFSNNGYIDSFGKFVGNHFYKNAATETDMLGFMPNWMLGKVMEKSNSLGHDPIIGQMPDDFGNHGSFIKVVNRLHSLNVGEKCDFKADKTYILEKLSNREKSASKVTPEGSDKSYIIKIDNLHSNPFYDRIRANSVYLESALGYYLTKNNCKNAAKFHYYDLFHDAALIEHVEGNVPEYKNILERNKETPDLLSLGVFCNDIDPENYRITAEGLKVIDLGHASYFDKLKPGDIGNTMDLPNFARPNFLLSYGSEDIGNFILKARGEK